METARWAVKEQMTIQEQDVVSPESTIDSLQERIYFLEQAVNAIGYDSKASKKRRFPRKTQEETLRTMTMALCVETIDPWKENRVRFYHPLLHDPKVPIINLPFASSVSPFGGFDDCGLSWVPPAGSTLMLIFLGGSRDTPFYIGTTWHRSRKRGFAKDFPEWDIYRNHRGGFFHGPKEQVLPPWNTENYNSLDIDRTENFVKDPKQQWQVTFPHIYGFKTPEKHMLKMVDGDPKCGRRWKRMELLSGGGNWMMFKDDHLHYGGQWAHPSCSPDNPRTGVEVCARHDDALPFFTNIVGEAVETSGGHNVNTCNPGCKQTDILQQSKVTGSAVDKNLDGTFQASEKTINESFTFGQASTPGDPPDPPHAQHRSQPGSNINFKNMNECRPYKGPGTPQNNKCDLPQSGIQFLSISGHTFVMDDSVEEPRGEPRWERSTQDFDYGCNEKYLGLMYMKSSTGHAMTMCDFEEPAKVRGWKNFMEMRSANGNFIQLNDETIRGKKSQTPAGTECESECQECPPDYAGPRRGVHIHSTSGHQIKMVDHMNLQCSPCRKEGGVATPEATKAYIKIKSGYGMEMRFQDAFSQQETQQQWIQIFHPQCVDPDTDDGCNSCKECECRGPHILRFQGRPKGQPGLVFLRAGGHSVRQTYDEDVVIVGDYECNPSNKFTYVSKQFLTVTEDIHFRYSGELHIFFAEKEILLMAGRDCPPAQLVEGVDIEGPDATKAGRCCGPCLYNVIIARCPVFCPVTNILHWTELSMSERVFASGYAADDRGCPAPAGCGGKGLGKGCIERTGGQEEDEETEEEPMLPTS